MCVYVNHVLNLCVHSFFWKYVTNFQKTKKRKKKKIKSETSNSTKKKYTKEFYNIIIKKDLYVIEEKRAKRIKYFKIKNS